LAVEVLPLFSVSLRLVRGLLRQVLLLLTTLLLLVVQVVDLVAVVAVALVVSVQEQHYQ
jgi:hypothetical protein